jgi:hypothetical protein
MFEAALDCSQGPRASPPTWTAIRAEQVQKTPEPSSTAGKGRGELTPIGDHTAFPI